jgi:phosphoserine phosphatase RsbU/P
MFKNDDIRSSSVLVVDDNPKNLQVLGGMLQKEGMEVEFALNGDSAINWLKKRSFDLVLLDILMPGMDGYEVCSIIKNDAALCNTPVIFITAKTDSDSIIRGFKEGGVDYITKPFIPSELMARVRSQINIQKSKESILTYLKEIEVSNRNIRDSIEYARNIQKAVMHTSFDRTGFNLENFIVNLPKDIVSGDFYWYHKIFDEFIIAVMDCTGHGVPGAFMSVLGITLLNEIVLHNKIISPDEILERLREKIITSLGQNRKKLRIKDGMEGAVISFNRKNNTLGYSGAFNPMIHVHNHEMNIIKPDRIPVGFYEKKDKFTLKTIAIEKGDMVYLSSDGYMDQFGGPEKRKIMSKGYMDLLLRNHNLPMDSQGSELIDNLIKWKGEMDQTDDILVVGIRF